jgi:hypothetical protein
MHFNVTNNGQATGVSSSGEDVSGGNTVTYNVTADSFAVSVSHPSVTFNETFAPANINPVNSNDTLRIYGKNGGNQTLIMLKPDDPELGLSYVTFGNWINVNSSGGSLADGYVVFGVRTSPGDVPRTGSAAYSGQTVGTMTDSSGNIYTVSGVAALNADFSAGTVNGDYTSMAKFNVLTTVTTPWRDFTTSSAISDNTFSGTAATKDSKLSGTSQGGFFGPAVNEIGGTYQLDGAGEHAVGAFVGKK